MKIKRLRTERLAIEPLTNKDSNFMLDLVNSDGWLRFIGDRKVRSLNDADGYVRNILDNDKTKYWVVKLSNTNEKVGIITLIQKDYLNHPDFGFAFLPEYQGKGYAYESAIAVLDYLQNNMKGYATLLAVTSPDNIKSVNLLERLGMSFDKSIEVEGEEIFQYSVQLG